MAADGNARPIVSMVSETLSAAGLQCSADATVWAAIWEKVAFNAALNTICAVTGCTVDQLGSTPEGSRLAEQVVVEVLSVAQRLGIDVNPAKCKANVAGAIAQHKGTSHRCCRTFRPDAAPRSKRSMAQRSPRPGA